MPVKDNRNNTVDEVEPEVEVVDPTSLPGFHVVAGDTFVGTYETAADAQAFIDGHLAPQQAKAKIVEGPAAE